MIYVNPWIKDLYRVKYHDDRLRVLRLDMNESPDGLPPEFVETVKEKITPGSLAAYPEKHRLTSLLSKHCRVPAVCLTLTSGSDEAMRLAFQAFGEAGKNLISVVPTFELYGVYAKMFGMIHVTVPHEEDWSVSAQRIMAQINRHTGMVILLNPNSPIGRTHTLAEARAIIEKAGSAGALVVIDEAYHYFYPDTFIPLISEYENVIILRTFSKLCAMAGLRVGYTAGNPTLIDVLERAEPTFNVNAAGILFAEEILKRPDIMENLRIAEAEGHRWLEQRLKEAGYKTLSLEGCYVLFYPNRTSGEVVSSLRKKGVWVRDYSHGMLAGWIRVSTGSVGSMKRFWEELAVIDMG